MKLILGNKEDLKKEKIITKQDIDKFTEKTGIDIVEVSAKSSNKVNFAFEMLTNKLLTNREKKEMKSGYSLDSTPIEGRFAEKGGCC